jgi:radical SAM superfamily enzyme YgiQ (UPF0313 family)/REP element-mobilizing transposase RayT
MTPDILFSAFNARYAHTSFGARYLLANMDELAARSELLEFDLQVQPRIAVEKILKCNARIVIIGCYIWNIDLATKVASLLKRLRPETKLILGGPEISYETEEQEIFQYADHIVCGEGETEVPRLCYRILTTEVTEERGVKYSENSVSSSAAGGKIICAEPVHVESIELPYNLYTDEDIAHRAIYVEASRGCPFRCEYCMSSLDPCVRYFPEDKLFAAFGKLLDRGALRFKFVDRTFNINIPLALKILSFFRARYVPGMMLHFEVIPDRLPDELMAAVRDCPPGMLQFEIGIQTFNEDIAHRIRRPLNITKIEANMRRLRQETGVHIHADLIAGLPGEDLRSFESGFNRLLALDPQEIQLGILKRLRGAPITRHSKEWRMVYSPHAPYEILSTSLISFGEMQRVQRFARYWDLVVNNGHFIESAPLIWKSVSSTQGRQDGSDTSVPPASCGLPETTGFNPHQEIRQTRRKNYPHWTQDGCTYFVTFRLADSIPQSRIQEYEKLRRNWAEHHKPPYTEAEQRQFNELFSERIDEWLDEGAGSCCLRNKTLAAYVAETIQRFDGTRYELDEWVVMPNHVHVLLTPHTGYELSKILHTWKSYSAHAINKELDRTGRLWQPESYDHIVRDLAELWRIRNYIRRNPDKAGLTVDFAGSRRAACDTVPQAADLPMDPNVPQAASLPPDPNVQQAPPHSPFEAFMGFSDWLYEKTGTTGNLHMVRLARLLMDFLVSEKWMDEERVAEALWRDYQRGNRPDVPGFLKKFGFKESRRAACDTDANVPEVIALDKSNLSLPRQSRHLKD